MFRDHFHQIEPTESIMSDSDYDDDDGTPATVPVESIVDSNTEGDQTRITLERSYLRAAEQDEAIRKISLK